MLSTPFGALNTLDLDDPQTQQRILFHDKHQLLEGIVAENHIDQILDTGLACAAGLKPLNVVSVIAERSHNKQRWALVLDQGTPRELLNPYLTRLANKFITKLVRYDAAAKDLFTHRGQYTEDAKLDEPYEKLTQALGLGRFIGIASTVRDEKRQQQSFWGQLVGAYGDRLGREVVLPRIFKNFAVQPWFDCGVWDIDRVYRDVRRHSYGIIEVKHKAPFGREPWPLKFGINCGSSSVLRDLASAGFLCFHSIMVKPRWRNSVSVTYLFNDVQARSRVLFCGKHFNLTDLEELCRQKPRKSPPKTSLSGKQEVPFVSFKASSLFRIGLLNDTDLSEQLAAALNDTLAERVTDEELLSLCLER